MKDTLTIFGESIVLKLAIYLLKDRVIFFLPIAILDDRSMNRLIVPTVSITIVLLESRRSVLLV